MISALVVAMALQAPNANAPAPQDPQAAPAPVQSVGQPTDAASLISKMLAHYADAKTLVGKIDMTQEAAGHTVTIETELQFERPNKIYLHQVEHSSQARTFLLTSDGKQFSYDAPFDGVIHLNAQRLKENTTNGIKLLDLAEIYTATLDSIVDPNHMVNIAIGRTVDLKRFAAQLSDFHTVGNQKIGEDTMYEIVGKYRLTTSAPPSGDFDMYVTASGDFRKFSVRQLFGVPNHRDMAPIAVTTTWVSSLQVGAKPNDSLFTVVQ